MNNLPICALVAFVLVSAAVVAALLMGGNNRGQRMRGSESYGTYGYAHRCDDSRASFDSRACEPRCTSQLAACRQACANMPLCDQRGGCASGCAAQFEQCRGDCPSE